MHILGLSCYFHDASAAILRDGQLIAAAEEERFSRVKHDFGFPSRAIAFCLEQAGIRGEDLDYVAFFEKPFVKFDRILNTTFAEVPKSGAVFRQAITAWLLDKMWVKNRIREALRVPDERILFVEHHQSHAASAFFCSPFDDAAILTVDGVGEWATATTGRGRDRTIDLTHEIHFPHSLGLLYSAFTAFLGFEVNEGEYKVMGMAPYGRPRFVEEVRKLINVGSDGSFSLNLEYFEFQHSTTRTYSDAFVKLFGAPRPVESLFFTEASGFPSYFGEKPANYAELSAANQRYADLAASIQAVTEETLLTMARGACERAGTTRLCMAGGVALNSVANGRILREAGVTDLFIQPAAGRQRRGPGGGALRPSPGAGASARLRHGACGLGPAALDGRHPGGRRRDRVQGGGMPRRGSDARSRGGARRVRTGDRLAPGALRVGPRALGQRSILADPRRAEMKDTVNVKIKFREPYRPFAPSVLQEAADRYFDTAGASTQYPARFMLLVEPVRPEARSVLPATTHVDNSARLQTVVQSASPLYHDLISRVGKATGVPVVMNTSFNLRGEPIVNTPAEAISTFARSGLDALVMDQLILYKDSTR